MSRLHVSIAVIGSIAAAGTLVFAFRCVGRRISRLEETTGAVQSDLRTMEASVRALQESNMVDAAMAIDLLESAPEIEPHKGSSKKRT